MLEEYDLLIRGGLVVDGTGAPPFRADVAVKGDKIVRVSSTIKGEAKIIIDAKGLIVTPGFIDAHSHADKTLPLFPTADSYVLQGVTTTIGGSCGNTIAPIINYWPPNMFWDLDLVYELRPFKYSPELVSADEMRQLVKSRYGVDIEWGSFSQFLNWLEEHKISVNHVPLVGHNTIRAQVMGLEKREPNSQELRMMKELIEEALEAGAGGLSLGLDYVPGRYAKPDELVELLKVVRRYDGICTVHWRTRKEIMGFLIPDKKGGVLEALEIARKSRVRLHLSHLSPIFTILPKPPSRLYREITLATLELVEGARATGVDITFDIIPNVTGGTLTVKYLASLLSPWLREVGSRKALSRALRMAEVREEIRRALKEGLLPFMDPRINPLWDLSIRIVKHKNSAFENRTIRELAKELNLEPLEVVLNLIIQDPDCQIQELGTLDEAVIEEFLKHPRCMIGLDTYAFDLHWEMKGPPHYVPHPNTYGGIPRYLRRYSRERRILTLEEAIRRLTSLPAERFGIKGRGIIKEGDYADLVILDYERVAEPSGPYGRGTPRGIEYVIVNGVIVVKKGKHTGARPGRILRREV